MITSVLLEDNQIGFQHLLLPILDERSVQLRVLNVLILVAIFLAIGGIFLSYGLDAYWIGHAIAGIIVFSAIVFVPTFGAMIKGRIKRIKGFGVFKAHRRLAILLGSFVLVTFLYGFWVTTWRYEFRISLPTSLHGRLGLAILVLAALQLIPSLVIKRRQKIRIPHRIIGYTLPVLIILQVILGVQVAIGYIT